MAGRLLAIMMLIIAYASKLLSVYVVGIEAHCGEGEYPSKTKAALGAGRKWMLARASQRLRLL
ncbi:MAG: hypothetical protein GDYSWBUE_001586 [Candidatus Fervidibacterota bacterium]